MNSLIDNLIDGAPIIGLLFFIGVFGLIIINLILPKNQKKFQDYSKIPLKDEQK
jgi:hypothetical protein